MAFVGIYINLDRCPERRAEIEGEFLRLGLNGKYSRLPAADGNALNLSNPKLNNGEIGCFTSHYLALKQNLGSGQHLHVIEDDTLFASCTESVINRIIDSGELDQLDLLYTDVAIPLSNDAFKALKATYDSIVTRDESGALQSAAFQILPLNEYMFVTTSSFVINKNSIEKLYRLYHEELTSGASVPIDVFLRQKIDAGIIQAGCVFPFITSVRVDRVMDSTVRKVRDVTYRFTAAAIARYSFFIGCDWAECKKMVESLPAPDRDDRHADILARVLEFSLVDNATEKSATKAA